MAIENLPDAKGYATSDLFIKHPTKDLWKLFVLLYMSYFLPDVLTGLIYVIVSGEWTM